MAEIRLDQREIKTEIVDNFLGHTLVATGKNRSPFLEAAIIEFQHLLGRNGRSGTPRFGLNFPH
jgi:hypothetical protein